MKFCCAVLTTLLAASSGASIKWTGIVNDQQWTTPNNWYPAQVPGPSDDVTIDDAEGKDAVVVMVSANEIRVRSVTLGNLVSNKAKLRVLAPLSVSQVTVSKNGLLEVNSGAAVITNPDLTVSGEWDFFAGSFKGNATVTGFANFGTPAAKVFDSSNIKITSHKHVVASGSLQFKGSSTISSRTGITSKGNDFQCIVQDDSEGNSFVAGYFSWKQ